MPIIVGTDTYISLADADTYAAPRGNAAWDAATDAQKEFALTEAAEYLDSSYAFKGTISSTSQALAWPRTGAKDAEGRTIDNATVPVKIGYAQTRLAFLRLAGPLVLAPDSGKVTELQAGSVKMKFADGQEVNEADKYAEINRLLFGLYETRAGQTYITASLTKA